MSGSDSARPRTASPTLIRESGEARSCFRFGRSAPRPSGPSGEIDRTIQDGHLREIAGAFEFIRILPEQRLMRLGSIELLEEEWSRKFLDGGRCRVGEHMPRGAKRPERTPAKPSARVAPGW